MLPFLLSFFLCLSPLYAEMGSEAGSDEIGFDISADGGISSSARDELNLLAEYLGSSVEEIVSEAGLPDEMYTVRGPSEGQDSVVFYYKNRVSLFWAESHVWQVRADREILSESSVLQMGMSRNQVVSVMGNADLDKGEYTIYTLPQKGYPVACALYYDEAGLSDLYVYRSDF